MLKRKTLTIHAQTGKHLSVAIDCSITSQMRIHVDCNFPPVHLQRRAAKGTPQANEVLKLLYCEYTCVIVVSITKV